MNVIHEAVADPDSAVGTTLLRDTEDTFNLWISIDPETGECAIADSKDQDATLPADYAELQALAKEYGISANQPADELRAAVDGYRREHIADRLVERYDDMTQTDQE